MRTVLDEHTPRVPCAACRPGPQVGRRDRAGADGHRTAWRAGVHPLGQRLGVYRERASALPRRGENQKPSTSSRRAPGRMGSSSRSTAGSATNASTASNCGRSPRPASSSRTSGSNTTRSAHPVNSVTAAPRITPRNSPDLRLRPGYARPPPEIDKPNPLRPPQPTARTDAVGGSKKRIPSAHE